MRMLKAAVLPVIVSSVIAGSAGLKPKDNGRVTGVALSYILVTNVVGAITGTLLAVIFQPGIIIFIIYGKRVITLFVTL